MIDSLTARAERLRATILSQDGSGIVYEPTLFPTALVAAIYKPSTSSVTKNLVFPEALTYVLARQRADGGWPSGVEDFEVGRILNTLAGLYALLKAQTSARPNPRIVAARKYLCTALQSWDPDDGCASPEQVRLVAKLLSRLKAVNVFFAFSRGEKLQHLVRTSEREEGSTNHVLVALVPEARAYRVKVQPHSLRDCGVRCSPAETALAMIDAETYSEEYELYLRSAIQATGVDGGVPAVFPTSLVEVTSILDILAPMLDNHDGSTEVEVRERTSSPLRFHLQENDVNISAQLLATKLLGSEDVSNICDELQRVLIDKLSTGSSCGSLDQHCHILRTLLCSSRRPESRLTMSRLFDQICHTWWNGTWTKTISRSDFYAFQLLTSAFAEVSRLADNDNEVVEAEDLSDCAPIAISQIAAKVLSSQNCNGAWGEGTRGCVEDTALAISSLVTMLDFPFLDLLALDIRHAIERGREVLISAMTSGKPLRATNANWLSATSYRSSQLCEAYILTALSKSETLQRAGHPMDGTAEAAYQMAKTLASFFHGLPNLSREPFFKLKAAAIESSFYVKRLKDMRLDIFPATSSKEKDKYFHYIPIMWCIHNSVRQVWAPPVLVWDISVVSLFIFLVDEYMEGQTASFSTRELADLQDGITQIFALDGDWASEYQHYLKVESAPSEKRENPLAIMHTPFQDTPLDISKRVSDALSVFSKWASYLMNYPSLQSASAVDLHAMRVESKNYLLYHIHQTLDNKHLAAQTPFNASVPFRHPSMGYAPWVHTISGGHIAATFALTWVQACFGNKIRGPGRDCFSSVKQKCMVWNLNSHSAKQLRMFNDYGSILRDAEERNLNSTNFPEFFDSDDNWLDVDGEKEDTEFEVLQRKAVLLDAARYERTMTEEEWDGLEKELMAEGRAGEKLARWLGLYFAGGDQFSDMYLFRDVTNSTK